MSRFLQTVTIIIGVVLSIVLFSISSTVRGMFGVTCFILSTAVVIYEGLRLLRKG